MSLPAVPSVPHALKQAHQTLRDQIERAKHDWSYARLGIRDAADHFVQCFCDSRPDAERELERRAAVIKELTAAGSEYAIRKKAAGTICRALFENRTTSESWAIEEALEVDFQHAFKWEGAAKWVEDVRQEQRGAENLRKDLGACGELATDARRAIEAFELACRDVVQRGLNMAADGCYQFWHLRCAIRGTGGTESCMVLAWMESSDLPSVWLDEIAAAADSLMAWGEASPADTGDESSTPDVSKLSPADRKAYLSFVHAEQQLGKRIQDKTAYDYLSEYAFSDDYGELGELADYELPLFATWTRQLRNARHALGEQKNMPRRGRRGHSVVDGRDIEFQREPKA